MKLSVTVKRSANVPNVATVFSNRYKGRMLQNVQFLDLMRRIAERTVPYEGTRARKPKMG